MMVRRRKFRPYIPTYFADRLLTADGTVKWAVWMPVTTNSVIKSGFDMVVMDDDTFQREFKEVSASRRQRAEDPVDAEVVGSDRQDGSADDVRASFSG